MFPIPPIRILMALLAAWWVVIGGLSAAEPPATIPVQDILQRADADERFAVAVMIRSDSLDPLERMQVPLDAISRSVDGLLQHYDRDKLRLLPVIRLESLHRYWKFEARRFDNWQTDTRQTLAPYAEDAARLARLLGEWEATRTASETLHLPDSITTRIAVVTARLREAQEKLSAPLLRQIQLGGLANSVQARIENGSEAVRQAISAVDAGLLHLDARPLWQLGLPDTRDDSGFATVSSGLQIETSFAADYAAANSTPFQILRIAEIILLPLLLWLAVRERRLARPADEASLVLRRPFSTWLLLCAFMVIASEPGAPTIILQTVMFLTLVPVLRLIPLRTRALLGTWPWLVAGLYLINRLGLLFMANPHLFRWFSLCLALVALAAVLLGLRSPRLPGRAAAAVRLAGWVAAALFTIAVVSNGIGNVSLAETLTSAVIDSASLALFFHAGYAVLQALIRRFLLMPDGAWGRGSRPTLLAHHLGQLAALAVSGAWLLFTMDIFRILRPVRDLVSAVLSYEFRYGAISLTPGHALLFAATVTASFWIARIVRMLLYDKLLTHMALPRGVGNSISSLTYYALLLLGLLVALSAAGFNVSQLALIFGALGVGIGFGLQNVVNNFVSGLILMFERPIQPGDVVEVNGTTGRVREIGMRATTVATFDGAVVVIPNGRLLSDNLTNWTLFDRSRRIEVDVGVSYEAKPAHVTEVLREAAAGTAGVVPHPAPVILFQGLGSSSLDFSVRVWTHEFDQWVEIRSQLVMRIHAALEQAGIEIPFPQQDLHLRTISAEAGGVLQPGTPGDQA